jgi:hypothetical protein
MADTLRTESYLLASLFQDGQAANAITAQDMRDLVVSMRPGFGECAMQGNATATTISVPGTYYKVAGTTALSGNEYLVDDASGTSNRLRYTGVPQRLVPFSAAFSFTPASNNQEIAFKVWLYDSSGASGAYIADSLIRHHSTGSVDAASIQGHAVMETNDYIEIHVANLTGAVNVTVSESNLRILPLFK